MRLVIPLAAAVAAVIAAVAGYAIGLRRGRAREQTLEAAIGDQERALTRAHDELLRKSNVDPETGLPGRDALQEFLEREWRRASRDRHPVSLLMIEVDHFRAYLDSAGTNQGECLKQIARALSGLIHRPGDLVAHYGPGQFAIVLGSTPADGAKTLAERMRLAVQLLNVAHPASPIAPTVTVSLGVASLMPAREDSWQDIELIAVAERSLARAREAGRNQVGFDPSAQP